MWRKRSLKHRYWDVLKRLRLVPGVAALARVPCPVSAPFPSTALGAIALL